MSIIVLQCFPVQQSESAIFGTYFRCRVTLDHKDDSACFLKMVNIRCHLKKAIIRDHLVLLFFFFFF